VKKEDQISYKIASKKSDGACVAAYFWGQLSAKTMFCASENFLACQGVGIVVDGVVNNKKVTTEYQGIFLNATTNY